MVVSSDDRGKVKVWNIRNFKCMQTLDFSDKVAITRLLDLGGQGKIAVLGSRVTLLHLEKPPVELPLVQPLGVKANGPHLMVFTQNDLRSYDF